MRTELILWSNRLKATSTPKLKEASLLLIFGDRKILENLPPNFFKTFYPQAKVIGCSTAGEIYKTEVKENTLVSAALDLPPNSFRLAQVDLEKLPSFEAGNFLQKELLCPDLNHIFLLGEGININASQFLKGLKENLPPQVKVSGGLAGDRDNFIKTLLVFENEVKSNIVIGLGFCEQRLKIRCGSQGGFIPFGPLRLVSKSKGNILYMLDDKPALTLYSTYLGDFAKDLPASALYFPLAIIEENKEPLVRSIVGIDKQKNALIFAGEIPEGSYVQLMRSKPENLFLGAKEAALRAKLQSPKLAILISCIGRKLILKERVEEEIEEVAKVLNTENLIGFYSYGEISPFKEDSTCELHNETMTLTVLGED